MISPKKQVNLLAYVDPYTNRPISACFITPEFPGSGMQSSGLGTYVDRASRGLAGLGHDITIIHPAHKPSDNVRHNVRIIGVPTDAPLPLPLRLLRGALRKAGLGRTANLLLNAFALANKAEEIARETRFSVIQYASYQSVGLFRLPNIPAIGRVSSLQNEYDQADSQRAGINSRIIQKLEMMALARMDHIIGPSIATNIRLANRTGWTVQTVETPFVPTVQGTGQPCTVSGRFILYFGTVNRLKGVDRLASIARRLMDIPDLQLVIAGRIAEGNDHILQSVQDAAGTAADRVHYLGALSQDDLQNVLQRAEMVILPSRQDNLPNACIEALAAGKIVIATRDASFEQLIDDGESGFLVSQQDADNAGLWNAAAHVLALPDDQRSPISAAARARAENLAPEIVLPSLIRAWETAIGRHRDKYWR